MNIGNVGVGMCFGLMMVLTAACGQVSFQSDVCRRMLCSGGREAVACVPSGRDSIVFRLDSAATWNYSRVAAWHRATDSVTRYGPRLWEFSYDPDLRDINAGWFKVSLPDGGNKLILGFSGNLEASPRHVEVDLVGGDGKDTFRVAVVQEARRWGKKFPVGVKETAFYVPLSWTDFSLPLSSGVWTYVTRTGVRGKGILYPYRRIKKVHREDSLTECILPLVHPRFHIWFRPSEKKLDFTKWQENTLRTPKVIDLEMKTVRPAPPGGREEIGDETVYVVLQGSPDE